MGKISILLIDDHKLIRDSWSFLLKKDQRFRIVGSVALAEEALTIAKEKHPRVVLMDINMTPVDGFELTKLVLKHSPDSKVIGLSMYSIPSYARKMMQMGAMGYVTKNSSKEEMITAIASVAGGNKYICNEIKDMLSKQEMEESNPPSASMNLLSQRELDVIGYIKKGFSSRQIAEELQVSSKTIEVHRYNILRKLKLKNTVALVNFINIYGL